MSALPLERSSPLDATRGPSSRAPLRNPLPPRHSRSAAGMAFWPTLRTVVVIAGIVDVLYFALFLGIGVPELAWPNVSSIVLYATAYVLIRRRINMLAIALIWIEVVLHAAAGTLLLGWESGFHYYMLLFVPAIAIGSERRYCAVLLPLVFICYLGLDISSYLVGPTNPIREPALAAVRWTNIAIVFTIFAYASLRYRSLLRHAEEALRFTATQDPLTGLANAHQFMVMAEHETARQRRNSTSLSIVIVGIDGMKKANVNFGREAGDRLLAEVGHVLRNNCRLEDVVCRWGGDEFAVLMPETAWQQAAAVAERIRRAAEADSTVEERSALPHCTISIGVSELLPQERFHDAFARAESALLHAKLCGRNRVTCEPPDAAARASRPMSFEGERAVRTGVR
jgi:diguanylate cyclase